MLGPVPSLSRGKACGLESIDHDFPKESLNDCRRPREGGVQRLKPLKAKALGSRLRGNDEQSRIVQTFPNNHCAGMPARVSDDRELAE